MSIIKVLSKETAEKIAAGEVVERPASIVKELVENSIDAGATSITVEISNGGTTFIRVTDNGKGIHSEDVKTAFLRHATSKISKESDLEKINTMGFRGEALASICAVCKVDILTRNIDEEIGSRYVVEGFDEILFESAGCPVGTTIVVRDVFFNTPARMKFLRKDVAEGNAVASILEKLATAKPDISFALIRDGRETMFTPGDGNILSSISAVMGRQFADTLMAADFSSDNIKIHGFISRPEASKASRGFQHFFVNGRYVKYAPPFIAVTDGYKNSIMIGKFPACVLFIEIDPSLVDVNVHPAKTEVKFSNEKQVYESLYFAVKSSLSANTTPKEFAIEHHIQNEREVCEKPVPEVIDKRDQVKFVMSDLVIENTVNPNSAKSNTRTFNQRKPIYTDAVFNIEAEEICESGENIESKNIIPENNQGIQNMDDWRYIGEIFNTYLVVQLADELLLIDKHAAHERYIFNSLLSDNPGDVMQVLMTPETVRLTREQYSAAVEHIEDFSKLGFLCEDFGEGYILVREAPIYLPLDKITGTIEEIAISFSKNKSVITTDFLENLFHSIACRGAMKGGDTNNTEEIMKIINIVLNDENVNFCPHGRPVAIKITKREIEKQFGRLG